MPISATCRACNRELLLRELVLSGTGTCPTCGVLLAPHYSFMLLDDARRADALAHELSTCLSRLAALPGNLLFNRDSVYEAIAAPLPATRQQSDERRGIIQNSQQLRRTVWDWTRSDRSQRNTRRAMLVADLYALAQRVRALSTTDAIPTTQRQVVSEAAGALANATARMRAKRWRANLDAITALDRITDVVVNANMDRARSQEVQAGQGTAHPESAELVTIAVAEDTSAARALASR
jgi:hypothetical protein